MSLSTTAETGVAEDSKQLLPSSDKQDNKFKPLFATLASGIKPLGSDDGGSDGNDGDTPNDGFRGRGDGDDGSDGFDDTDNGPFRANNSTVSALDGFPIELPPKLRKSPLLALAYRLWVGLWRRSGVYGTMGLYVLNTAKTHVLPMYVAASAAQFLSPFWLAKGLQLATRSFFVLFMSSLGIHALRNRVAPLVPPVTRQQQQQQQGASDAQPQQDASAAAEAAPYAVVTGASSGIGRAIAADLARQGWNVVLIGRHRDALREHARALKREARAAGRRLQAHVVEADLAVDATPDAVYEQVRALCADGMQPEILVNSAGVAWDCEFADLPEERLQDMLMINCVATTRLTQLFARDMKERKASGRIMIVSSITAAMPNPKVAVYAATKSYLTSLAQALSVELEPHGVGVTCLMPGATYTAFQARSNAAGARVFKHPRLCMTPEEVARQGVEGMLRGDSLIVTGWMNKLMVNVFEPLLPRKIGMLLVQAFW